MKKLVFALATIIALCLPATGQLYVPPQQPSAPDMSNYATKADIPDMSGFARKADLNGLMQIPVKSSTIPTTGPGVGVCQDTIVPSNLLTVGGVTGTAGSCSTIRQCGTSGTYVIRDLNVGSGC